MNSASPQPALRISQLEKHFAFGAQRVLVLRSVNFAIAPGEFVSIVGGSGCGKSTLLRIVAGLENSFTGSVTLDGQPVDGPGTDRGIVFQEHRLFPWLTVEQNIAFGLRCPPAEKARLVRAHIELVGLKGFATAFPSQLSGGMAQRAAIARAIVSRPKILLLDEPFGALDAFTRIQMQEELLKIWHAEQCTIILVTHDIDEAIFLSDRVLVMSNRPGTIRSDYEIKLARPRDRHSDDFVGFRREIFHEFFAQAETPFNYAI